MFPERFLIIEFDFKNFASFIRFKFSFKYVKNQWFGIFNVTKKCWKEYFVIPKASRLSIFVEKKVTSINFDLEMLKRLRLAFEHVLIEIELNFLY